jgi:hypothetical protein
MVRRVISKAAMMCLVVVGRSLERQLVAGLVFSAWCNGRWTMH